MASLDRLAARTARASLRAFGENGQILRAVDVLANPDVDPKTLNQPQHAMVVHDVERADGDGFVIRVTEITVAVDASLKKGDTYTEAAGRQWLLTERVKNDNHLVTWVTAKI